MTAQVTSTPGDTETLSSGAVIVARPGVRYQIADVDPADGSVGPVLAPPDLVLALNDPDVGDLTVTLPDGTVLVFQGMIDLFDQGTGFANASGELVVASPEDAVAPASGQEGGEASEGEGSSAAFNDAAIGDDNDFGRGPGGDFAAGEDGSGEDDGTDPNEFLATLMEDEELETDIPLRVIDPVDPTPPVTPPVPKPGCPVCTRPSITYWNEIPSDASQEVLAGTSRGDLFVSQFADLQTTLALADVITGFEDGVDQLNLILNGAGPVTLSFTEQSVAGVGTAAADTVISIQGSGEIIAILQDVNAAAGATIDNNDIFFNA